MMDAEPMHVGATAAIADYVTSVRPEDVPTDVRALVRRALLNYLGCAMHGAQHPSTTILLESLREHYGGQPVSLFGRGGEAPLALAAVVNATAGCVDAFCDTHAETIAHPSAGVFAAALAIAERDRLSGPELMQSSMLGIEIACRLSMAIAAAPAYSDIGLSQTGLTTGIGAAVAVGKLLQLDSTQMNLAIGIAASHAFGIRVNHGTMTTPLMHGQGAETGIRAALLAKNGFTASSESLEGKHGFLSVYAERAHLDWLVGELGSRFETLRLTFKPYPCGIVVHPLIDAALAVRADTPGRSVEEIEAVSLTVHSAVLGLTAVRHPASPREAQYSAHHWIAVALAYGTATISDASEDRINDPAITRLRDMISFDVSEEMATDAADMTVVLKDGSRITKRIEHCAGSYSQPMTNPQVETKFQGLVADVVNVERARKIISLCADLEDIQDVSELCRAAT